jgi:hypothetical protein
MKRLSIAVSAVFILAAAPALAQTPLAQPTPAQRLGPDTAISPGELTPTPEMWFYEQNRRDYLDPQLAVRRNAEYRAARRLERMAAMDWFGFSNQRPQVNPDPFNADWSPTWTSNNGVYSFRWNGVGWASSASRPPTGVRHIGFVVPSY